MTWPDTDRVEILRVDPDRRGPRLQRFFGVVRPQPYRNLAYAVVGLPLGIAWFTTVDTGAAMGISMLTGGATAQTDALRSEVLALPQAARVQLAVWRGSPAATTARFWFEALARARE
jgi:hypothetical protein